MTLTPRMLLSITGAVFLVGAYAPSVGAEQWLVYGSAQWLGVAHPDSENPEVFILCDGTEVSPVTGELRETPQRCGTGPITQAEQGEWLAQKQQAQTAASPQQGEREIIGIEVVGQNGEEVGQIRNVLVDEQGQVKAVIIQHGAAVLGAGGQHVAVPFDRLEFPKAGPSMGSGEQQAKIDMTEQQVGELPEFESTGEMREESPGMQPRQPDEQPGETGTPGTAPGQQRE